MKSQRTLRNEPAWSWQFSCQRGWLVNMLFTWMTSGGHLPKQEVLTMNKYHLPSRGQDYGRIFFEHPDFKESQKDTKRKPPILGPSDKTNPDTSNAQALDGPPPAGGGTRSPAPSVLQEPIEHAQQPLNKTHRLYQALGVGHFPQAPHRHVLSCGSAAATAQVLALISQRLLPLQPLQPLPK